MSVPQVVHFNVPDDHGRLWRHELSQTEDDKYYYFGFGFNKILQAEISSMQGRKWLGYDDPPRKVWRVPKTKRNQFQIDFLKGTNNPYIRFKTPVPELPATRFPLKPHQRLGAAYIVYRRETGLAFEMGTGKTLLTFAAQEILDIDSWLWVAPKSAMLSVQLEMQKWGIKTSPSIMTYDALSSHHAKDDGPFRFIPKMVVFDESQRIKTPTAKRSQAAAALVDRMRDKYPRHNVDPTVVGDMSYGPVVVLLSGSPAPRSPLDWWHQTEVLCPGYLKEGSHKAMTKRLAWVDLEEGIRGQKYEKIKAWKDDERKCDHCSLIHEPEMRYDHAFVPSKNEVSFLYKRMSGLVHVAFKKDCLDLPEQTREVRKLVCDDSTLRKAQLVKTTAKRAIDGLTKLRELSDGFIYQEVTTDVREDCVICKGTGKPNELLMPGAEVCDACDGLGWTFVISRTAIRAKTCPKWDAYEEILDHHSDIGRLVVYAGFEGSIDLCVDIAVRNQWDYIRVDGRGYKSSIPDLTPSQLLQAFQQPIDAPFKVGGIDRLVFIGHPGAAGTGLTLTASPTILFYSNTFNAEERIQAEARNHRIGTIGSNIIDLVNLPTDAYVLANIQKKRDLQSLTLGELAKALDITE